MGTPAVVLGTGITRSWEGGNVAETARTCLDVCVIRVVDSFRNINCLFEGKKDVGIRRFVATYSVRWLNESPVVDVPSRRNIANMI